MLANNIRQDLFDNTHVDKNIKYINFLVKTKIFIIILKYIDLL